MPRPEGPAEYAVADPSEAVPTKWRGHVDRCDPLSGVSGWAFTADSPADQQQLELVVGETPLCCVATGAPRPDIDAILGVRVTPGFNFPRSIFARLAHLKARRRELPVRVRFAGTRVYLIGPPPVPTVGELVDAWRQTLLAPLRGRGTEVSLGDRLLSRLAVLRTAAEVFLDQPLRPLSDADAGRIESCHAAANGLLWFTGWLTRSAATEFPALVVDRQKYPAGAVTLHYERQDLSSRHVGVFGLMDTRWAPPAVTQEFFIHAGADAHLQLRAGAHTALVDMKAMLTVFSQATAALVAGNAEALGAVLGSGNHWTPGGATAAGLAADAAIDRLLMIPGFGCIGEGWAVSPAQRVRTLELKVGDAVLTADELGTYFQPRPDLSGLFAGGNSSLARGGFVTAFRGDLPETFVGAPLLRVLYDDGTASVHAIDAKRVRHLNFIDDSAEVLRLYPSLRHEPFYPALLAAVRRRLRDRGCNLRAISVTPMLRAIVIRLPAESCNQRLCCDFIAQLSLPPESGIGCCLVVDDTAGLTTAKLLFNELRTVSSLPLSLFCVHDGAAFAALPMVLAQLETDRFVYVDCGTVLTVRGWVHAVEHLCLSGHAIRYFEFIDDTGAPDRINGIRSAACFGWSTAALFSWLPSSTPVLRGVRGTNGLPPPHDARHAYAGAAIRLERVQYSRLADWVDDDLLSSNAPADAPSAVARSSNVPANVSSSNAAEVVQRA